MKKPLSTEKKRSRAGLYQVFPSGRKRGARNKSTMAALALLSGETEKLTRIAIDTALGGE